MSALARLRCALTNHDLVTWMLPEDGWGLYAFSRISCSRCGYVSIDRYPFEELARYNAERGRGIVHDPAFVARMAIQQEYFDQQRRESAA